MSMSRRDSAAVAREIMFHSEEFSGTAQREGLGGL